MSLEFTSDRLDTDNPFIDLLMYTMKLIAGNCVIKDQYAANDAETKESLNASTLYMSCKDNNATLNMFDSIPEELLRQVGMSSTDIELYQKSNYDLYYIPKDLNNDGTPSGTTYRRDLVPLVNAWYVEKYESNHYSGELNEYYRKIIGLPPIGDWGVYLRDYEYLMPDDFTYTGDYLHEVGADTCILLDQLGILDVIKNDYPDAEYINYVTCGITPYEARNKMDFQILYSPRSDDISFDNTEISSMVFSSFSEEFINKYNKNRDYMITAVYSEAMEVDSEYYHAFMVVYTILITMVDVINEVQSHIIKMDILNRRCVEYIFSMYGVPFYREIPEKWQEKVCKNIHKILKYKSSTQEMINFKKIFGFESIRIMKYYLLKERYTDSMGDFLFNYSKTLTCSKNDIIENVVRTELISEPPAAQPVPQDVGTYDIYAKSGADSTYNDNITSEEYKGTITEGYTERYIVYPFDYFLQKGNVMFIRIDDYVLKENTDYSIYNYNRIRIKSSLLEGHTNIIYDFYYDKNTITQDFDVDTEHALKMVTKTYKNPTTYEFDLSPIPWSNYWDVGNAVIVSVNSVWLNEEQYSIDTTTNILTIDSSLNVIGREVYIILLYCKHIRSKYKKVSVKATEKRQTTFFIPDPFPFYTLNENEFFITMGTVFVHPQRYTINRSRTENESFISFIDGTKVAKGRTLEFNFLYSRNAIINKIELSYQTMTLTCTERYQTEFPVTFPVNHYSSSGYLVYVKYLDWYMQTTSFTFTDNSLILLEESLALRVGDKLELTLVYINEDRTEKTEDNIKIAKDYQVAKTNRQKTFTVDLPTKHYDTKYNKIVVDVNGFYLDENERTVVYNALGDQATITINNYDYRPDSGKRVNFTYFYNMDAEYNVALTLQEIPIDPIKQTEFSLDFPFFPYLQTGHDFLAITGSTLIAKSRIKMKDQFTFNLEATDTNETPGRTMIILYIYNNYYTLNSNRKLIVEWKDKSLADIAGFSNTDYLKVPVPFENYIQNGWNYFVTYNNRAFMHEDIYDIYDDEFYTYPVTDLKNGVYGDTITFTFIYLIKKPWVYYATSEDYDKDMALQFCKLPIEDLYSSKYIRDKANYVSYDSMVNKDGWWDGHKYKKNPHSIIKQAIYKEKFNYARSKYYGSTQEINASDYSNIMGYFYSMIYDSVLLENDLKINIPSISSAESFRIADLFVFMTCLTYIYNNLPDFEIEWNSVNHHKYAVGFNFKTSLDEMKKYLIAEHRQLDMYDIWDMIIPTAQIPNMYDFMNIYHTDLNVRQYIMDQMMNSENYNEYRIWEYLYDNLMNWKLDLSFFKLPDGSQPTTYNLFLKSWAPTLYYKINDIKNINDEVSRNDGIISLVDDIVYILEQYIDSDIMEVICDRFPGRSVQDAMKYMMMFINFYKSYKIQFISSSSQTISTAGDEDLDNTCRPIDTFESVETNNPTKYYNLVEDVTVEEKIDIVHEDDWLSEEFSIRRKEH